MIEKLSDNHWRVEHYVQRMTTKGWKKILLCDGDKIFVAGEFRRLVAKNIGYGIVEISKEGR